MAVEDFGADKGINVEIVSADHQNKPDVGSTIARQWYDTENVDVIVDVPTSSVALAINDITRENEQGVPEFGRRIVRPDRRGLLAEHGPLDLRHLGARQRHRRRDGAQHGGDSWFFVTADYAFGHALERDTTRRGRRRPAARSSAPCARRSRAPTSRPSCSRRRPRAPR